MSKDPAMSAGSSEKLSDVVRPGDDLFRYVNGYWLDTTEIPEDRSRYGTFDVLVEGAERAVRDILDETRDAPLGTPARQLGDLYASFLNESRVEELGAAPLMALVDRVASLESVDAFVRTVGDFQRRGLVSFYDLFVNNDPGDPERYVLFLEQGGLSLPDESYYRDENFAPVRDAFVAHVTRTLARLGLSEPDQRARRVVDLETKLARHHWDTVASRDSEKTYNPRTWVEFVALAGVADGGSHDYWTAWRDALGVSTAPGDTVVVRQPSFAEGLAHLLDDEHLDAWRDWLRWHLASSLAPFLSSEFVAENFDFFGRTLTGTPALRDRWKRAVSLVEDAMGDALGRLYVERYFPPTAKAAMDTLVDSLLAAYRESITTRPWMSEATRDRALEKLGTFAPKIGYPSRWRDFSGLRVEPDDLVANVLAAGAFEFERQLAKLGAPLDREEWLMTPQTVNAYYNPGLNEIVFPAAILQPPFFDLERDDAQNYGAIGAVIGHEIGHGFDDQGSKFDGAGKLADWWTPDDRRAFEGLAERVMAQYDALSPAEVPDQHVNGAFTVGENIGDLGGLHIAWRAYELSRPGASDDDQGAAERFFISWARAWRNQSRPADVERRLAIDPHSPPEFRCNQVVRNIDAFYEAFGVAETDALWLDPDDRVTIW